MHVDSSRHNKGMSWCVRGRTHRRLLRGGAGHFSAVQTRPAVLRVPRCVRRRQGAAGAHHSGQAEQNAIVDDDGVDCHSGDHHHEADHHHDHNPTDADDCLWETVQGRVRKRSLRAFLWRRRHWSHLPRCRFLKFILVYETEALNIVILMLMIINAISHLQLILNERKISNLS